MPLKHLGVLADWNIGDARPLVSRPWTCLDRTTGSEITVATNGHCLIAVFGAYGESASKFPGGKFPDVFAVLDVAALAKPGQRETTMDLARLKKTRENHLCTECDPKATEMPRFCKECGGTGEVIFDSEFNYYECQCKSCDGTGNRSGYYPTDRCPHCHGTKWNENAKENGCRIEIGGVFLDPIYVHKLNAELPGFRFLPDALADKYGVVGFAFSGGIGAVMGLLERR